MSKTEFEKAIDGYIKANYSLDDDGYVVHIRKGQFNGNGLSESITYDNLEDIAAWVYEWCEKHLVTDLHNKRMGELGECYTKCKDLESKLASARETKKGGG